MTPDDLTRKEFAVGGAIALSGLLAGCRDGVPRSAITVVWPREGSRLQGRVVCLALVRHCSARRVSFWVDGVMRHSDRRPPFRWAWDTRREVDGPHRLEVRANLDRREIRSAPALVRVANSVPGGEEPMRRVYYGGLGERTHRRTMTEPIAPCPDIHPGSGAFRAQVKETAQTRGGWTLSVAKWTCAVYFADASTPRITVGPIRYAPDDDHRYLKGVPISPHFIPDPGDFHMAVYDLEHGIGFEFFGFGEDPVFACRQACQMPLYRGDGWAPYGWGATDSGANASTGAIWPDELAAGHIPHALKGAIGNVEPDYTILPATNSGGTKPGAAPYGTRIQLDPSLDLEALRLPGDPACRPDGSLKPWQRTVARCLQAYGWYISDQGGVGIGAVNARSFGTNPYREIPEFDADATQEYMPVGLIDHFRFLDGKRVSQAENRAVARIPDLRLPGAATWSRSP
jgi:hypothetical protein